MENNETDPYPLDIDDTEKRHYMTSKVMKERDKERQRNRDRERDRETGPFQLDMDTEKIH